MSDYILTCCSTADMPDTFFKERGIYYVCFHYTIDGESYPDDLGKSMSFDQFYKRMLNNSRITSYNVCYTKLLRMRRKWPTINSHG